MASKSTVLKSRSSNGAIARNELYNNKKCSSNAGFQRVVGKKRGVYVEKKSDKLILKEPETRIKQEKLATPPPRRNKEKFVPSTLKIQSKATTGTQYPDTLKREKLVRKRMEKNTEDNSVKKKNKYRSKALNKAFGKDYKEQSVTVLKQDTAQTPAVLSENAFNILKVEVANDVSDKMGLNSTNNSLEKQIIEGKQLKQEKRVRIDEPLTLVSGIKAEGNDGLYDFFVDFLQTTINAYNNNAEDKHSEFSASSYHKNVLEIDEPIIKKLNINRQFNSTEHKEHICCNKTPFCCLLDKEESNQPKIEHQETKATKAKRLKAKSFAYAPKPRDKKITSESFAMEMQKKRKQRKETVLNLFKDQLRMSHASREPESLYQALKIMAQNKRRYENRSEDGSSGKQSQFSFSECMYRSRRILSMGEKSNKTVARGSFSGSKKKRIFHGECRNERVESNYSLNVSARNYDDNSVIACDDRLRDFVTTYHSAASVSDCELNEDNESDITLNIFT